MVMRCGAYERVLTLPWKVSSFVSDLRDTQNESTPPVDARLVVLTKAARGKIATPGAWPTYRPGVTVTSIVFR